MRLDGIIALVTGAGSGIGRALALELARRGARLLLVGRRTAALEQTCAQLPYTEKGIVLPADITNPADRETLVRRVAALGKLDLLVNNAGVMVSGPVEADDQEVRRRVIDTNLLAPMELTSALLPQLRAAAPSRIVNVGSMFGDIAFPYFSTYSASKFGLRGWSDALRRELAPAGIGVTYAAPRGTRTPAADRFAGLAEAFAMRLDPPERVAVQIADAIAADAPTAYPRGPERLFVLLQRLLPRAIDRALGRQLAKAAARLAVALVSVGTVAQAGTAQAADLTVTVAGIRGTTGKIRVDLYSDPDTFRHEDRARQVIVLPAAPGKAQAVFRNLPAGRYAVLAYHDENGDGKLNLILGMFPAEGWGLSNDPTPIGPPAFADSAFDVADPATAITVPLHY